ncbi:MAG: 50S ribosomal protein L4 [Candidatus Dormibacteria bacterium]
MPEAGIYNLGGEQVGQMALADSVFGITPHVAVMHQALLRQLANARQGTHDTRTRGEVQGGGRKPYRQKGTGRARHGSRREPQFRGGGVVFGPHPHKYTQAMPRKMRRLALRSALSAAVADQRVRLLDSADLEAPRTRAVAEFFGKLNLEGKVLLLLPGHNIPLEKSASNLPGTKVLLTSNLNVRDLFTYRNVIATVEAVRQIEEALAQ